jgi:acyl carrier protein
MNEIKEQIREMTAGMLEIEPEKLGEDDLFAEHDMDSFAAMQLVAMLESEYDIVIPDERLSELKTVNATAEIVTELMNK